MDKLFKYGKNVYLERANKRLTLLGSNTPVQSNVEQLTFGEGITIGTILKNVKFTKLKSFTYKGDPRYKSNISDENLETIVCESLEDVRFYNSNLSILKLFTILKERSKI